MARSKVKPAALGGERVVIERGHFEGRDYVQVRVWFQDAKGYWHPTKRGASIRAELFKPSAVDELRNALLPPMRPGEPVVSLD